MTVTFSVLISWEGSGINTYNNWYKRLQWLDNTVTLSLSHTQRWVELHSDKYLDIEKKILTDSKDLQADIQVLTSMFIDRAANFTSHCQQRAQAPAIMYKKFQRPLEKWFSLFNNTSFISWFEWLKWVDESKSFPISQIGLQNKSELAALTFDSDLSGGFDHAQRGDGHAGVVGRLADVGDLQHVPPQRHLLLLGQLHHAHHPLDVRHRGADCHAREVDAAARHHLLVGGRDGESGRDSSYYGGAEEWKERICKLNDFFFVCVCVWFRDKSCDVAQTTRLKAN